MLLLGGVEAAGVAAGEALPVTLEPDNASIGL